MLEIQEVKARGPLEGGGDTQLQCPLCSRRMDDRDGMRFHLRSSHNTVVGIKVLKRDEGTATTADKPAPKTAAKTAPAKPTEPTDTGPTDETLAYGSPGSTGSRE